MPEPKRIHPDQTATLTYLDSTAQVKVKYYSSKIAFKDPLGSTWMDTTSKELVSDSLQFKYWSFSEIFSPPPKFNSKAEEVLNEIENIEKIDSTQLAALDTLLKKDSIPLMDLDKVLARKMRIQYPKGKTNLLYSFFESLGTIDEGNLIRVLHYGDSQIEGDRITSQLRRELQKEFGGCGVGMVPIKESTEQRVTILSSCADNWVKYLIYGPDYDKEIPKHFSLQGNYFRYNEPYPEKPVIDESDTTITEAELDSLNQLIAIADSIINARKAGPDGGAWFTIKNSDRTYKSNRKYENYKVMYGRADSETTLKISSEDDTLQVLQLPATAGFEAMRFTANQEQETLTFTFEGNESPNIYGVAFDCDKGIAVDNIGLRGTSGLEINRMSRGYLQEQVRDMNVKLIMFQFGVNSVPGEIMDYNYYYKIYNGSLAKLKSLSPNMSVLVIGITDMSKQVGETYMTYPNIEIIRKAQRDAAFNNNCAYFDLFDAMGGENSMPSWVARGYAGNDYTHFSYSGATKVSKMLYRALMLEYGIFKSKK